MASTYSTNLRIELMADGENSNTWGGKTNTNLTMLEQAVSGVASVAMTDADYTLTTSNAATDEARNMVVTMTGTLTQARNVIVPSVDKVYVFKNSTTGGFAVTVKTSGGTGISVVNGETETLYCDATNVLRAITTPTGTGAPVRATSPTLVTPTLGTPASGTLTNCTGLPTAGLANDAVTYAKLQNVSATDKLLGRSTAGAGDVEEITCTSFARSILDDANEAAFKATVNLEIGVDVQAYDATLTSLSGLSLVEGDIVYATAADTLARLAKGTASQELRMNAGATAPEWYTPTAASSAVIKVVEATPVTSVVTIATATTLDDSIPQNTEGTEVITVSIMPTSASNRLRIEFNAPTLGTASSGALVAALFQDTTANALAAGYAYPSGASAAPISLTHEMAAGTTASTTFKIRLSCQSGSAYLNGNLNLGTRAFGGVSAARLRVTELAP